MRGGWKKILLGLALLIGLAVAFVFYAIASDEERMSAATNPCEHDCLQDSGGVLDCRQECANHPLTYGPAAQQPVGPKPNKQ